MPSDPACPTCGTRVRANCYWDYLSGPFSPRVYYPKSIMDDNPEIAGSFTRCADPFHAAPSDPAAVPPPEWAVEMANTVGDCGSHHDYDGACCAEVVNRLASLLASVREGALREAAAKCRSEAREWERTVGTDNGARDVVCDDLADAILALLYTPPSGGAG